MSTYIQYLDLPSVPEELIESVDSILSRAPEASYKFSETERPFYEAYPVLPNLKEWIMDTMPFKITSVIYQAIYFNLPIHKDSSEISIGINYLLHSGGDNIYTSVYNEDKKEVLQTECIREREWHKIKVNNFHGVEGIPKGNVRVSLRFTVLEPFHSYDEIVGARGRI